MSAKSQKDTRIKGVDSKTKWLLILLLIVLVLVYYGNTLKNGYSLDDDLVTSTDLSKHKRVEKGVKGIPEIFTTHYVTNSKQRYDYRPMVTSTFALEYSLVSDKSVTNRAFISHFINVLLYALVIVLIFLLVSKMLRDNKWKIPFTTALFFLIHPIHSEVVNNIKCRDELMVMIFGILTTLVLFYYIDSKVKKKWHLILAAGLIICALLSKSTAQIFIVVIPLIIYFFRDVNLKKAGVIFGGLVLVLFLSRMWENLVLPESQIRDLMFFENPLAYSDSFSDRIPMFFYTNFFYLKMMLMPIPLVYYYGYDQIPIADWSYLEVWVGMLLVSLGTLFSFFRIKKKELWVFGILFFLFGIGGAANLLFPAVGIVAERFIFIGSFGLIFIAAYYFVKLLESSVNKKLKFSFLGGATLLLISSFSYVTHRNKDWESRLSLYGNDIANLSRSVKAHSLLGTELTFVADSISKMANSSFPEYMSYVDSAISEFKTCVEIYDGYYNAANNAGALYFTRKYNHYKAKPLFRKALEYKPDYVEALFNYGNCFESDLKGVKELQLIVGKNKIDSVSVLSPLNGKKLYLKERKASYAIYRIKKDAYSILSAVNLNTLNWGSNAIYKIMLSIKTNLDVEDGLLKSKVNVKALERQITERVNDVNSTNAQRQLQVVMSFIEGTFFQLIEQELKLKQSLDEAYFNQIDTRLTQIKHAIIDSIEYNWGHSLEADPTYYYSYKALTALYLNEGEYEKVKQINEKALAEGEFTDNMEFYLNIGNVYNYQKQYSTSILFMEKAVAEIDKSYAQIFNDETVGQNQKQASLLELIARKKQIMGFVVNIAYAGGDFATSTKYQEILSKM